MHKILFVEKPSFTTRENHSLLLERIILHYYREFVTDHFVENLSLILEKWVSGLAFRELVTNDFVSE